MSLFGTTSPKFKSGTTTVVLSHSVLKPDFISNNVVEHVSKLTGARKYILRWSHSDFTVTVNLFKYSDPAETLKNLLTYNGVLVDEFYPFGDGSRVEDSYGAAVKFFVTVECYFLKGLDKYDLAVMKFKSEKPTSIKETLTANAS